MGIVAKRAALVLLALGMACGATGCTFYLLPGDGPSPRAAYADHLGSITPAAAAELAAQATVSHGFTGVGPLRIAGTGDLSGWTLRHSRTFEWLILIGPIRTWWHLEPGTGGGSPAPGTAGHAWGWGMLAPLFVAWGCDRSYDVATGQGVAREDLATVALGMLVYHRATWPARKWLVFRDPGPPPIGSFVAPDVRGDLGAVPYDHVSALALGWGAFAVGTRNRRAYLQLAWIPIPLWRVSE